MPGIAGIIRREPYEAVKRDLSLMVESMRHKPYYVANQYVNEEIGLYAGWTSHPGSIVESMPLMSHDKHVILVIVGEHFAHPSRPFSSDGNGTLNQGAKDLLRLYEESESRLLSELNGWFSGLAITLSPQRITLFNDRYGMGRIYFY